MRGYSVVEKVAFKRNLVFSQGNINYKVESSFRGSVDTRLALKHLKKKKHEQGF